MPFDRGDRHRGGDGPVTLFLGVGIALVPTGG
jgi:hypothetical protein